MTWRIEDATENGPSPPPPIGVLARSCESRMRLGCPRAAWHLAFRTILRVDENWLLFPSSPYWRQFREPALEKRLSETDTFTGRRRRGGLVDVSFLVLLAVRIRIHFGRQRTILIARNASTLR